jgi:mgtE-like transporter
MKEHRRSQKRSLRTPLRWVGLGVRALLGPPARAVRGTARRVADPARQVVDYWSSERVTMRQGFVAVFIAGLTSLVAGLTLAGMDNRIEAIPGLFVLIPVTIGMRGNMFEVSSDRNGTLFQNVHAAALLTLFTSVAMGLLARAIAALLGVEIVSVWDLVTVALVGGVISSAVVLAAAVGLSITALRRGWDLDAVGSPLITAIGDVVTLPCLLISSYLVAIDVVTPAIGTVGAVLGAVALVHGWTVNSPTTRRIVRESVPVLCVAIVLDILAGSVVEPRVHEVFLPLPAFLIILPGFLENTGALGGILSARLGSKLHLGAVTPSARPEAAALLDGTIILALGLAVYGTSAVTTLWLAELFDQAYPGVVDFIGVVLLGGALATFVAAVIGYYGAIISYRFGFDPDNHTIPVVTSGMDLLGVICLIFALGIFGVA